MCHFKTEIMKSLDRIQCLRNSLNVEFLNPTIVIFSRRSVSVSAVKCPSSEGGVPRWPPLGHVLRNTRAVFYETILIVPPSRPWSSLVPRVSPAGPEHNAGCPTVVWSSRHLTSRTPFDCAYRFHDISYFVFFSDPLSCFTILPCDVEHDCFYGLLFRKIPGLRSVGDCW